MIDLIGGPGRDRTDDLFHAMEARSQTAPQAHTGKCNFSIVSGWAAFVKPGRIWPQTLSRATLGNSAFVPSGLPSEEKTFVTGNTCMGFRCLRQ